MRITSQMLINTVIRNLQRNGEQLLVAQEQASSGQRVNRPSDDPAAAELALRLRNELGSVNVHLKSVDAAQTWLNTADDALDSAGEIYQRVRQLVVQAGNSTLQAADRQSIAAEIEALAISLQQVANTRLTGRYLFSGFRTDVQPFPTTTVYNGDNGQVTMNVDDRVSIGVSLPGDAIFSQAFGVLSQIATELNAGNAPAANRLDQLDQIMSQNSDFRAEVGARLNRLEAIRNRLIDRQLQLEKLHSESVDVDLADALIRMQTAQSVYQAALGVAGRTIQPTLLDFLR